MQGNGIGPLVSQFVHERNALRAAGRGREEAAEAIPRKAVKPHANADTIEFSASALARFEALKARLGGTPADADPIGIEPPPGTDPADGVDAGGPGTEPVPDDGASGVDPTPTDTVDAAAFAFSYQRVEYREATYLSIYG